MKEKPEPKVDITGVDPKRLRNFKQTMFLTEREVGVLAAAIREILGVPLSEMVESHGLSFEDNVRFGSVQAKCVERREAMRKSIRDVSRELRVPQYRLKDVEAGRVKHLEPDILESYIAYLGIKPWYRRWSKANEELSSRIGVGTGRSQGGKGTKKK